MEIPFELFDEITGTGNAARTKDPSDADRRQHRRLPFGSRGTIAALHGNDEGPTNVVMLRDISVGGIGFLNAEPLKIGETFVIRFSGQGGLPVKVHCAAQRCDAGGTGGTQFVIGATFEKLIEPTTVSPRIADGQISSTEPSSHVAPTGPVVPLRKSSLFQTPKVDVAGSGAADYEMPFTNPAPVVATIAPCPAEPVSTMPIEAAVSASPKPEERIEPVAEAAKPVTVEVIPTVEATPRMETAPAVVQRAGEPIAPTAEAAPGIADGVESVQTPVVSAAPEVSVTSPAATQIPVPVPAAHVTAVAPGKNQELVAQFKARFLKQNQAMKSQFQQVEEHNRQLAEQKAQIEELGRQRDALHAMFVKAGQQLSEEQDRSAKEIESLRREVLELRENQGALQAKSDSDDLAIAELAALLDAEAGVISTAGK